ncbi:Regulatory-associated protein of mTOR [Geodia barretti]|uniref:Regulatory-associated protein of mTOR n=1 Tax=Geodia barretti TaxID=519541 RepID=A0AA35WDR6_GEOBA|nr:Regulatory-associated protein of mTOR [Geodia barretti]
MRSYKCTPESHPALPPTHQHPLWQAWDLALDHVLSQLPDVHAGKKDYEPSQFFSQQLSAFQVWLMSVGDSKSPPQQLPIVLQFLLSQAHRLQALELLGRFLDLGSWAVHSALTVGIFPYVLKLLGSKLRELQPILMFIWAKILAVDPSCQKDLVKDNGYKYFVQVLGDTSMQCEYRTMAAFAISAVVNKYPMGQERCLQSGVVGTCLGQLEEPNPVLRQWLAICLGRLWQNFDSARWYGARDNAHDKLISLLWDEIPDVRAAAVFALGTYLLNTSEDGTSEMRVTIDQAVGSALLQLMNDASPVVRMELASALHGLTLLYEKQFHIAALHFSEGKRVAATNLTTSVTPTGWIHVTIAPQDSDGENEGGSTASTNIPTPNSPLSTSLSGNSQHSISNGIDSLASHAHNGELQSSSVGGPPGDLPPTSRGSISNGEASGKQFFEDLPKSKSAPGGASLGARNWYQQIWRGMVYLASDPFPKVADAAQHVVHGLHDKLRQKPQAKMIGATLVASYSAPCSPKDAGHTVKCATLGAAGMKFRQPKSGMASSAIMSRVKSELTSLPPTGRPKAPSPDPSSSGDEDDEGESSLHALSTQFCDWCCKYFANPLMKQPSECDPASPGYQQREYRFIRNHLVREEMARSCLPLSGSRINDQIFVNREARPAQLLKFHPYQPQLAVIHRNCWSIWDIEQGSKVTSFQENCTYSTAKITAAEFINPHDISFLLVGSEDGAVHVWRDYCQENSEAQKPTLVTAWRGLLDMLPVSKRVGMVLEWEQQTGLLYASGDVRHVRVWDTHKELMVQDIPTHADSSVTCLTSDSAERSLLIAGCGDGTVRLYDRRQPSNSSLVLTLREHQGWIVNVLMQQYGSESTIVSCRYMPQ